MLLSERKYASAAALFSLIVATNAVYFPELASSPQADIPNQYIVTLKPGANPAQHVAFVQTIHATSLARNQGQTGKEFEGITFQYNISDFQAYAGHFDDNVIAKIKTSNDVEAVEPDKMYATTSNIPHLNPIPHRIVQYNPPIGLNLISHRGLSQEHKGYAYDSTAGKRTYAYVVDTGIDVAHPEFEGRAVHGFNAVRHPNPDDDSFGHGTHVAGIIGGRTYGIAKSTHLISVKVFDGRTGSLSEAMAGYDWAVKDIAHFSRQRKSVINLSLGGPPSPSFNKAVSRAASKLGITTVVAAGNDDLDAATSTSPASAPGAIAVGATDAFRVRANYSNFGEALALFAPGSEVLSAWPGNGSRALSGTSMAAPHVAGLVAYLMGFKRFGSAKSLRESVVRLATKKVVGDIKGSPNAFAYNNGGSQVGVWG